MALQAPAEPSDVEGFQCMRRGCSQLTDTGELLRVLRMLCRSPCSAAASSASCSQICSQELSVSVTSEYAEGLLQHAPCTVARLQRGLGPPCMSGRPRARAQCTTCRAGVPPALQNRAASGLPPHAGVHQLMHVTAASVPTCHLPLAKRHQGPRQASPQLLILRHGTMKKTATVVPTSYR